MTIRILIVEDDEAVQQTVYKALEPFGYDLKCVATAEEARECLDTFDPHLIILDIMLPGENGKDFCREIRPVRDVPIIFLSGLDEGHDRIVGLELGADDYLTKPFIGGELLARVRAVLRRTETSTTPPPPEPDDDEKLRHGPLTVDKACREVWVGQSEVDLTKTEFDLLATMMRRPGRVYSRDELREGAYGPHVYVSDRTINSHIRRAREKLREAGLDPIETIRGIGYRVVGDISERQAADEDEADRPDEPGPANAGKAHGPDQAGTFERDRP